MLSSKSVKDKTCADRVGSARDPPALLPRTLSFCELRVHIGRQLGIVLLLLVSLASST